MKEKDKSNQQAIIKGHYVSEISSRQATHRIYHYQVTLGQDKNTASRHYEGELHICEAIPVAEDTAADIKAPPPANANNSGEMNGQVTSNAPEEDNVPAVHEPVSKTEANNVHTDITGDYATPLVAEDKPLPALPSSDEAGLHKGPPFLALFSKMGNRLRYFVTTRYSQVEYLFRQRNKFILPVIKLKPQRNIFSRRSRRVTTFVIASLMVLTLTAMGSYWLLTAETDLPHNTTPTVTAPITPSLEDNTPPPYHAVIEKTGDGVVITLQGPDHEEVLTRLPPGYSPVLEGNKVVHIVTPGNTLWFIAKRYVKNPYRYPELARLNKIPNPDLIYPGDKVIIQYLRKP